MPGLINAATVPGILLAIGILFGALDRRNFRPWWLILAAGLVLLNDMALTNVYGLVPDYFEGMQWNWQGKVLALVVTLAMASLLPFGRANTGMVLRQIPASLKSSIPVVVAYSSFFFALALAFPSDPASPETIAFQLTMPGLEEEAFYRGLLLAALDRAFCGRIRILGVDWGWGAVMSCMAFGLAHALGYSNGAFAFDPMVMALTAVPALLAVWLRYRTGSLLLPVALHNAGNSASFLV